MSHICLIFFCPKMCYKCDGWCSGFDLNLHHENGKSNNQLSSLLDVTRGWGENTERTVLTKEIGELDKKLFNKIRKHKTWCQPKNNRDYKPQPKGERKWEANIEIIYSPSQTMTQPHDPVGSFCWPKCLKETDLKTFFIHLYLLYIYFFLLYIYMLSLVFLDSAKTQKKT